MSPQTFLIEMTSTDRCSKVLKGGKIYAGGFRGVYNVSRCTAKIKDRCMEVEEMRGQGQGQARQVVEKISGARVDNRIIPTHDQVHQAVSENMVSAALHTSWQR